MEIHESIFVQNHKTLWVEKPAERSSGGACDHGGVDPDIDGIRADRGTSGGVFLVMH